MVVAEKSAETFSAMYRSRRIGNLPNRPDALVPEPLVRSFLVMVGHVLAHGTAQLLFVHGDQMVHALRLDREHEPLGVGVQVRTAGREPQALHAAVVEHAAERGGVERIPVEDQIADPAEEAVFSVGEGRWCTNRTEA
jgi:hypothetical protein